MADYILASLIIIAGLLWCLVKLLAEASRPIPKAFELEEWLAPCGIMAVGIIYLAGTILA